MKKMFNSSLLAMFLLCFCINLAQAQDDKVYDHIAVENPPMYPGGIAKFYQYLGGAIKYPAIATENNVQGTVPISFIIEKDGTLTDIKTNGRKVGYGIDEEALRVIKTSPRWNPASLDGKPVRVRYNIPIKFSLPGKPKKVADASKSGDIAYSHITMENPPTYPGGMHKFYEFLGQNIKYPKAATDGKVEGIVRVSFTIEKDGSLTEVKSIDNLGAGTDEEAIRVMKLSKRWNPGLVNGTPVRVTYQLPIKFSMKK